jgi:6-pyruvoyltetrahydropterin/6-carboxytetrahydropterin synthase
MMGWFKNFIDDTLDHKFIMDLQDPLYMSEFPITHNTLHKMPEGYYVPDLTTVSAWCESQNLEGPKADAIFEKYEGAVFVDFVPTSENLAGWLGTIAEEKMKGIPNVRVSAVEYWETPKSHCRVEF